MYVSCVSPSPGIESARDAILRRRDAHRARVDASYRFNLAAMAGKQSGLLSNGESTGVPFLIVCASAREHGRYQLSWLDSDMRPAGHAMFDTMADAVASASGKPTERDHLPHGGSEYRVVEAR